MNKFKWKWLKKTGGSCHQRECVNINWCYMPLVVILFARCVVTENARCNLSVAFGQVQRGLGF